MASSAASDATYNIFAYWAIYLEDRFHKLPTDFMPLVGHPICGCFRSLLIPPPDFEVGTCPRQLPKLVIAFLMPLTNPFNTIKGYQQNLRKASN